MILQSQDNAKKKDEEGNISVGLQSIMIRYTHYHIIIDRLVMRLAHKTWAVGTAWFYRRSSETGLWKVAVISPITSAAGVQGSTSMIHRMPHVPSTSYVIGSIATITPTWS